MRGLDGGEWMDGWMEGGMEGNKQWRAVYPLSASYLRCRAHHGLSFSQPASQPASQHPCIHASSKPSSKPKPASQQAGKPQLTEHTRSSVIGLGSHLNGQLVA